MKKYITTITIIVSLIAFSCTKNDKAPRDLKSSLEKSVADINNAISVISTTSGYEMLTAGEGTLKSETSFMDSIALDMVAGVYDFKPDPFHYRNFFIPYRLFKRTDESEHMIVNMPEKLVFRPRYLRNLNPPDSLLRNNFTIDASDYHYFYTWFSKFDYLLSASFLLDSVDVGTLDVVSSGSQETGRSYSSTYPFAEGYSINTSFMSGDSSVSSFALSGDDGDLLRETVIRVRKDHHFRERLYILTLGNVEIRRGTGIDSIQVYLDGVLQQTAGAKIYDSTGEEGSICHHRDILLTFDDGTTENLSDLIQPARDILRTLVDSMHSMRFASNVVDYIAIGIYYHSRE